MRRRFFRNVPPININTTNDGGCVPYPKLLKEVQPSVMVPSPDAIRQGTKESLIDLLKNTISGSRVAIARAVKYHLIQLRRVKQRIRTSQVGKYVNDKIFDLRSKVNFYDR